MNNKKAIFGNGILKTSVRENAVFVDEKGNTWICDKDVINSIDLTKPFEGQHIERCQVMPFDFGG